MIKEYLKYKSWYRDSTEKLKLKYGDDLYLICGLIAAISPQMLLDRNLYIAEKIYNDYRKDSKKFLKFVENKTKFFKKYGLFKPHYNNILKVLYHDFKTDLKLNGNKVYNFYLNLIGDYKAVTIDTWILKYFNHDKNRINHLRKSEYYKYANIIKKEAKEFNLLPAEYQAILWIKIRVENGSEAISFSDLLN